MPDIKRINKLIKKVYPATIYSKAERSSLRSALLSDIMDYIDEHDNMVYEELESHFSDKELINYNHEFIFKKMLKCVIIVSTLLLIICMLLYLYSNGLEPGTIYL